MSKSYSLEEALKSLEKDIDALSQEIQQRAKQEIRTLAGQTHAIIVQKATEKLKSTRSLYLDNLDIQQIESSPDNEIWAVTLGKDAGWIENGQPPHDMLQYLTKGPKSKMSKDGHRYAIIPFKHNKAPTQTSLAQQKIANYAKNELKKRGWDKTIMRDGKPVLGRAAHIKHLGAPGAPVSRFNQPILSGLTVYQREVKTKSGKSIIKRDVMTFRVASDKQKGSGLWQSNGRPAANIFDEASREVDALWEQIISKIVSEA